MGGESAERLGGFCGRERKQEREGLENAGLSSAVRSHEHHQSPERKRSVTMSLEVQEVD